MARYIDADELKSRMLNYYDCVSESTDKSNYRGETLMNYEVADMIEDCIDNAPTADVAPRAEVAREILADIRDKGGFNDPFVEYICLSYDELIVLERKYTATTDEPPKAKQPKDSENYEKKRLLPGDCFHGEIWYRCPYCFTGVEAYSIPKDRICHKCGKEYL